MSACIHLITDRTRLPEEAAASQGEEGLSPLGAAVQAALKGGVDWVQVRDKSAPALQIWEATREIVRICSARGGGVLVNDRADVAVAARAHGVHLAKKSLPPEAARAVIGSRRLLGVSVHSVEEARAAAAAGADYITFGHVFATPSKPGLPPRGLAALEAVVEAVDIPVLAIGGITPENVRDVLATGCAGIAVIGAILSAPDPEAAALRLREAVERAGARPRYPFPSPQDLPIAHGPQSRGPDASCPRGVTPALHYGGGERS